MTSPMQGGQTLEGGGGKESCFESAYMYLKAMPQVTVDNSLKEQQQLQQALRCKFSFKMHTF